LETNNVHKHKTVDKHLGPKKQPKAKSSKSKQPKQSEGVAAPPADGQPFSNLSQGQSYGVNWSGHDARHFTSENRHFFPGHQQAQQLPSNQHQIQWNNYAAAMAMSQAAAGLQNASLFSHHQAVTNFNPFQHHQQQGHYNSQQPSVYLMQTQHQAHTQPSPVAPAGYFGHGATSHLMQYGSNATSPQHMLSYPGYPLMNQFTHDSQTSSNPSSQGSTSN
jgi:hypothetical protein